MSDFEIRVHDIVPPLCRCNLDFVEEQKYKRLQTSGEVIRRNIYIFPDDEDDDADEAPSIEVLFFANGDRIMIFFLGVSDDAHLGITMPIDGEVDLRPEDLLFTIKHYVDHTDIGKLQEDLILTGKTRGAPHPHKIN